MANQIKYGFWPVESKTRCTRYEIASGYATSIFAGDPVTLVTAGTVEQASAGGADLILGVASHFSRVVDGIRQDVKYWPASSTYSPTARGSVNAAYVWVWDDPHCEFWCSVASHADTDTEAEVRATLGGNFDLTFGSGSTTYGTSTCQLDGNVEATVLRFEIKEFVRVPGNDLSAVNWKVKGIWKEHQFNNTTAGI